MQPLFVAFGGSSAVSEKGGCPKGSASHGIARGAEFPLRLQAAGWRYRQWRSSGRRCARPGDDPSRCVISTGMTLSRAPNSREGS
jgi:hypothetical protein